MTLNDYQHYSNDKPKSHGEQCLSFYLANNTEHEKNRGLWKAHTGVTYLCAHQLSYISLQGEMFIIYSLQIQASFGKIFLFLAVVYYRKVTYKNSTVQ